MTKGYPIFEWIPLIQITDQTKNVKTSVRDLDYEDGSLHISETKDYITGYEEE